VIKFNVNTLRFKFTFAFVILNLILSAVVGYVFYTVFRNELLQTILEDRKNLAVVLGSSIEAKIHDSFHSSSDFKNPEFIKIQKRFNQILNTFSGISYLYTLRYDSSLDEFLYVINGQNAGCDTVWVESDLFSFEVRMKGGESSTVYYNGKEYSESFNISLDGSTTYTVEIPSNSNSNTLFINGEFIFKQIDFDQFEINTKSSTLDNDNRYAVETLSISGRPVTVYTSITLKGQPMADPGAEYVDSQEVIQLIKKTIESNSTHITGLNTGSSWGDFISIYVPLESSRDDYKSLIVIDMNLEKINEISYRIVRMTLMVSFFSFVIILIAGIVLIGYIVKPIKLLEESTNSISNGNYDVKVNIKRNDEIGNLAKSFNTMVTSLNRAYDKLNEIIIANQRFVPREFLNLLGRNEIVDVTLGDQVELYMTVLFSDIRSFTHLSESMSPEENFNFVNKYLDTMTPVIHKHKGIIDKYIGDAIMALFSENTLEAVNAAVEMFQALNDFNKINIKESGKKLQIGIGIHTGKLMLGVIGHNERMEGTVISDVVNVSSRLEDLTKKFGSNILISEDAFLKLPQDSHFTIRFTGNIKLKGKNRRIRVYEVLDSLDAETIERRKKTKIRFESAVIFFEDGNIEKARELFSKILEEDPDDPASRFYYDHLNFT
jgi:class 3 adenylate cyclase/HAMP domain-containing protein